MAATSPFASWARRRNRPTSLPASIKADQSAMYSGRTVSGAVAATMFEQALSGSPPLRLPQWALSAGPRASPIPPAMGQHLRFRRNVAESNLPAHAAASARVPVRGAGVSGNTRTRNSV
jgi:hypothetical protein